MGVNFTFERIRDLAHQHVTKYIHSRLTISLIPIPRSLLAFAYVFYFLNSPLQKIYSCVYTEKEAFV